jgi:hypothetical protein
LKNSLVLLLERPIRYASEFGFCKQGFLENCRGLQLRGRGLARFRKNIPQLNSVVVLMQPAHRTNLGLNIKRLFMGLDLYEDIRSYPYTRYQRPKQLHDLHWLINLMYYTQPNQLNQGLPDQSTKSI